MLLLLVLSGCAGIGMVPPEKTEEDQISIAALFQAEDGGALHGGSACFSAESSSDSCEVDRDGTASISGLPRNEELLLTLFDQQQEVQGTMTLSFDQGAVIDATTDEDGIGHITVRDDTSEVALMFVLAEDGALRCTLWLARTNPS